MVAGAQTEGPGGVGQDLTWRFELSDRIITSFATKSTMNVPLE
jgi:hypothetical protein